jgi:hypothetical protein
MAVLVVRQDQCTGFPKGAGRVDNDASNWASGGGWVLLPCRRRSSVWKPPSAPSAAPASRREENGEHDSVIWLRRLEFPISFSR